MYLSKQPTRGEILEHYQQAFTSITNFRESWNGRFNRSILGSFKDLEREVFQELEEIEYLKVHPAADLSEDDWALFEQLDLLLDEDLEELRNGRMAAPRAVLCNSHNYEDTFINSLHF